MTYAAILLLPAVAVGVVAAGRRSRRHVALPRPRATPPTTAVTKARTSAEIDAVVDALAKDPSMQPYLAEARAKLERTGRVYRGLVRSNVTTLREIALRMAEDRDRNAQPSADFVIRAARQISGVAAELAPIADEAIRGGVHGISTSALVSASHDLASIGEDYLRTADRRPGALRNLTRQIEKLEAALLEGEVR